MYYFILAPRPSTDNLPTTLLGCSYYFFAGRDCVKKVFTCRKHKRRNNLVILGKLRLLYVGSISLRGRARFFVPDHPSRQGPALLCFSLVHTSPNQIKPNCHGFRSCGFRGWPAGYARPETARCIWISHHQSDFSLRFQHSGKKRLYIRVAEGIMY